MYVLREEGNITAAPLLLPLANFYPRPPQGGRLGVGHGVGHHIDISIHALREEGDWNQHGSLRYRILFYPRPP